MSPEELEASLAQLKSNVIFAELKPRTLIEVTGSDRKRFLHNLCTNDVDQLTVGNGCEVFFTTVQGKTLLHAFIYCHESSHVIDASAGQAANVIPHLTKYALIDDVVLTDRTAAWKQLLLAGPQAFECLQSLGLPGPTDMLSHASTDDVVVRRVPFTKEPTFVLQVARDSDVPQRLREGGWECSDLAVLEAARIEAGFPEFGLDITEDNLPQEVARDHLAISFTKGCYLGQETVARIDALGHVNKYLVRLEADGPLQIGEEVFVVGDTEKPVGHVTSVTNLPGRTIAMGYLRREPKEAGTELQSSQGPVRVVS